MSACSVEEVAATAPRPFWFQTYLLRKREINESLFERAQRAGCRVLVVTVDTKTQGPRDRDVRNGFTVPPRLTLRNAFDTLRRPRWLFDVALGPRLTFANPAPSLNLRAGDLIGIARFAAEQYDYSLDWSDIDWCRARWPGKLAVKGILDPHDALSAAVAAENDCELVTCDRRAAPTYERYGVRTSLL
jgi:L-lactate dehydrogenase (cytochrome)